MMALGQIRGISLILKEIKATLISGPLGKIFPSIFSITTVGQALWGLLLWTIFPFISSSFLSTPHA